MKVEINTESKNVLYLQGKYPVGHITRVMEYYVRQSETFDRLHDNMKARIKELEERIVQKEKEGLVNSPITLAYDLVIGEIKKQLMEVDCWWEPSMEGEPYEQECDMQLRHFKGDKLGGGGL